MPGAAVPHRREKEFKKIKHSLHYITLAGANTLSIILISKLRNTQTTIPQDRSQTCIKNAGPNKTS